MAKQPFNIHTDLGVPKVDWSKVNTDPTGPTRYPSEERFALPPELGDVINGKTHEIPVPDAISDAVLQDLAANGFYPVAVESDQQVIDKKAIKELTGKETFGLQAEPLKEPIGETPKFNPLTQQFELPE